jgi:hypothetical protein
VDVRNATAVLLLGAVACRGEDFHFESYWETRSACGLEPEDVVQAAVVNIDSPVVDVGEDCVDAMIGDFGIDVDSFGEPDLSVQDLRESLDFILGGLHALLASDLGTVGQLREDAACPGWFRDEAETVAGWMGASDDDPAALVWYSYTASRIEGIRLSSETARTHIKQGGFIVLADPVEDWALYMDVIGAAGLIAHESAHRDRPGHIRCDMNDTGWCDADTDGTLGLETYLQYRWAERAAASGDAELCDESDYYGNCVSILDVDDFEPCQVPKDDLCGTGLE